MTYPPKFKDMSVDEKLNEIHARQSWIVFTLFGIVLMLIGMS